MDRRDFVRAGGVVAASSLAGCAGVLGGAQPEKANERIAAAEDRLTENADELDETGATFSDEKKEVPDEFDPSSVASRVEKANAKLDEAEEYATDEQQSYVDTLRKVGEYQIAVAKAFEDMVALTHTLDTVNTYMESERYDRALEKIDEARSILSDVRGHVDEAGGVLDDVDADSLGESDRITYEDIEADLSKVRNRLDLLEGLLDGMEPMIEGMRDFVPALEEYGDGNYAVAADGLAEAGEHFRDADEAFRKLENADTTLSSFEADVAELTCYTGALADGATLFEESARAAERGDDELAREKANEAEDAVSGCNFE